ncbi:hypothetical protein QQ045_024119 [Rhodiola kirilowii]
MLAIFDGSVARRPDSKMLPHKEAVSALKHNFLANHFASIHPDSVIITSVRSYTFAYSLKSSTDHLPRFQFAHKDNISCMYQGRMEEIDANKEAYGLNKSDTEASIIIRAFHILRQEGDKTPKKVVQDISKNCISILYESPSKFVLLTNGSNGDLPLYWGIDARFCLVRYANHKLQNAILCRHSVSSFFLVMLAGQVYISGDGHTGLKALFTSKPPQNKLDFTDKNTVNVKSVTAMFLKAYEDWSKSFVKKWQPPRPDYVKINTDAVTLSDGTIGIGVIIRNSKGEIELAVCLKETPPPRFCPKVFAFLKGIYLASGLYFPCCISELAHPNIASITEEMGSDLTKRVLGMITLAVSNFNEFSVSFVDSRANRAARRLAKYAKKGYRVWDSRKIPKCISNIVTSERPNSDAATV